ncbi:MAG: glycosyltransferase family 39 protein [Ferruginibacter sp.]|nr:glycosyltransferase family 39 protein [Ferruginibacter sp.]
MNSTNFSRWSYRKKAIVVVLVFLCLRIIVSNFLNLGNDESYYWTFSQQLQWNYFDHPPMVAIWIRLFTANLLLEDYTFFLRLGSFVGCAISSYFIYNTIKAISTEKAGFAGVILYNISFYTFLTTGLFIMPDTPQMVFFTASMYFITQLLKDDSKKRAWIFFGITAGLCIMSKVHGVFLWGGVFLYALFYKREWFKNAGFYISMLITAVIISPVLTWNIQNDFITYRFHSERITVNEKSGFNLMGLLREIVGQILINNPFNIGLIMLFFFKRFTTKTKAALQVFKLIGVSFLLVIFAIALFRNTLPHWSGPAYISLLPIAAIGLSQINFSTFKVLTASALVYTILLVSLIVIAVNFYAGSYSNATGKEIGKNDISLDAYGWKEGGEKFAVFYNHQHVGNKRPPLVCNTWWGGHDEYYFARPLNIKMIGLAPVLNIHQYAWRIATDTVHLQMDTAYAIVHSYDYFDASKAFKNYYNKIDSVHTIPIMRAGKLAYNFYVCRLSGWKQHF